MRCLVRVRASADDADRGQGGGRTRGRPGLAGGLPEANPKLQQNYSMLSHAAASLYMDGGDKDKHAALHNEIHANQT